MKTKNFAASKMKILKTIFSLVAICISFLGVPQYVSAIAATPIPETIAYCDWMSGCDGWTGTASTNCMSDISVSSGTIYAPNASCQSVCAHFSYGNFSRGVDTKPYGDPVWMYSSDVYCGGGYSCPGGWTLSGSNCFAPDLTSSGPTPTAVILGGATTLTSNVTSAAGGANTAVIFNNVFQFASDTVGTSPQAPLAGTTIAGINVSQTKTTTYNWTPSSVGTYYVRACADNTTGWASAVVESNEGNNCSSNPWTTITVVAPDFYPDGGVFTSGAIIAGSPVALSANFKNIGTANTATTFPNVFQFANDLSGSGAQVPLVGSSISGLNINQIKSATYSWTPASAGDYFIRSCADNNTTWGNTVVEAIESNNCGAWTKITVGSANVGPVVNAGADQTITLPANTLIMAGSATDSDGTIASKTWSKFSGPATFTITTPTAYNTTVTGLVGGTYVFRLTATDNSGATGFDDMTATVALTCIESAVSTWDSCTSTATCTTPPATQIVSGTRTGICPSPGYTGTAFGACPDAVITCTAPVPTCNNNGTCNAGETLLNCYNDCKIKIKYQQF